MDALFLSRVQFALTSMFHYIYPPLSIGLGLMLVIFEGIYIKTKDPLYKEIARFWTKIFALTFALGVATGVVQLFGFGTNWARYSVYVGDVFGSALGAEGVFAFFLESGFLGLALFGWERVSARMHYFSTICVCLGAHFSALWIVVANSWMQTPAGFDVVIKNGAARAHVTDFWQMVFNPSSIDRLVHVLLGCWLAGIFLVISVTAYYLMKRRHLEFAKPMMKISLLVAAITLLLQLVSADSTASGVVRNQPAKMAAMEGVYQTAEATPLTLLGWVNDKEQTVKGIQIPGFLSFLCYRNWTQAVPGLDQIPLEDRPPVQIVFQSYHLMIWMWGFMALAVMLGLIQYYRGRLMESKRLLFWMILSVGFPQIANQAGWVTAEVGRQPWIVYGLLRTSEGLSTNITAAQVMSSIIMFSIIFSLLLVLFLYLLDHKIKEGPNLLEGERQVKPLVYRNLFSKR